MKQLRLVKNTLVVLVVTAVTAALLFAAVVAVGAGDSSANTVSIASDSGISGTQVSTSSDSVSSGTLTCPRTGCTASYCHATQGGGR